MCIWPYPIIFFKLKKKDIFCIFSYMQLLLLQCCNTAAAVAAAAMKTMDMSSTISKLPLDQI